MCNFQRAKQLLFDACGIDIHPDNIMEKVERRRGGGGGGGRGGGGRNDDGGDNVDDDDNSGGGGNLRGYQQLVIPSDQIQKMVESEKEYPFMIDTLHYTAPVSGSDLLMMDTFSTSQQVGEMTSVMTLLLLKLSKISFDDLIWWYRLTLIWQLMMKNKDENVEINMNVREGREKKIKMKKKMMGNLIIITTRIQIYI